MCIVLLLIELMCMSWLSQLSRCSSVDCGTLADLYYTSCILEKNEQQLWTKGVKQCAKKSVQASSANKSGEQVQRLVVLK